MIARPKSRKAKTPSRSDRVCWYLSKVERLSYDDIATRQGMSLLAVGQSIQRMNDHKALHSDEAVNLAINELVLKRVENVDKVIMGAMSAKIVSSEKRGKRWVKTTRPDHATQLKAVDTIKGFIETIRPKAGGVNIAMNQQNNLQGGGSSEVRVGGNTFEERLRRMRDAKGLSNNDEVIEAEFAAPSTLQEEMEEFGIDLEDEDEIEDGDVGDEDSDAPGTP